MLTDRKDNNIASGEEDGRVSIVASGDAAPVRQTVEHNLDTAPASAATLVVFDRHDPEILARN